MRDYREFFSAIIERNALAQSIILLSYSRTRAWEYARFLSQKLLCVDDTCERRVTEGIHPDIVVVGASEKNTLRVEDVRAGCEFVMQTPYEQRRRILIVDNADLLSSHEEAANALLKTLEEPPSRATIILITTESESLLPTIRSRCQTYRIFEEDFESFSTWFRSFHAEARETDVLFFYERSDILPETLDLDDFHDKFDAFDVFMASTPELADICDFADKSGSSAEMMISFLYTWCREYIGYMNGMHHDTTLWQSSRRAADKKLVNIEKVLIIMDKTEAWHAERRRNIQKKYILVSLLLEYFRELMS